MQNTPDTCTPALRTDRHAGATTVLGIEIEQARKLAIERNRDEGLIALCQALERKSAELDQFIAQAQLAMLNGMIDRRGLAHGR